MGDDQWLSAADTADVLRISISHVRVLAHRHKWRRVRHGRFVAYHAQDVLDEKVRRDTLARM